jgi:hypothetical protein
MISSSSSLRFSLVQAPQQHQHQQRLQPLVLLPALLMQHQQQQVAVSCRLVGTAWMLLACRRLCLLQLALWRQRRQQGQAEQQHR